MPTRLLLPAAALYGLTNGAWTPSQIDQANTVIGPPFSLQVGQGYPLHSDRAATTFTPSGAARPFGVGATRGASGTGQAAGAGTMVGAGAAPVAPGPALIGIDPIRALEDPGTEPRDRHPRRAYAGVEIVVGGDLRRPRGRQ